jgi:hypothetical protein
MLSKSHRSYRKVLPSVFILLFFYFSLTSAQNLIGYSGNDIRRFMTENRKDMHFNTVRNSQFRYLKYSDSYDTQTLLFFLSPESVCSSIRLICDRALKTEKLKELDSKYVKLGKNMWLDSHGGREYLIQFTDEKWSCTISYESQNPDLRSGSN